MKIFHEKKVESMLVVMKNYHAGQFRNKGRIPYWHHCLSVAEIVANAINESRELKNDNLLIAIICAAIGHDLFEDTTVERETVVKQFGSQIEELIVCLTNEEDDAHRAKYMEKIKTSSEEVALIKYADLIENTISCAYSIQDLGIEWMKNFYLPIKDETKKTLSLKKFILYPKTAAQLREQFAFAEERLVNNINKY